MRKTLATLTLLACASFAHAQDVELSIEVPALNVAEYHRPYVAAWLENENGQFVANLSVWYDQKLRNNEGEKWLKDMRQWWRKSGRTTSVPVEGVTGATRPVGVHTLTYSTQAAPFSELAPGKYQLRVEAAREVGGREMVTLPFTWPQTTATKFQQAGDSELGTVQLTIKP
ncbi:MAG TPA: DUF2271 domain-containing protein [Alcanivoracaceae bacterium]|nr:DUF2271 domain-containing protein [Alcanivoracaceae bacterium]